MITTDTKTGNATRCGVTRCGRSSNWGDIGADILARAMLALQLEPLIRELAKKNQQAAGGDRALLQNSAKAVTPIHTGQEIANMAGVSRAGHMA